MEAGGVGGGPAVGAEAVGLEVEDGGLGGLPAGIGAAGVVMQSTAQSLQVTGAGSTAITVLVVLLIVVGMGLTVYGLLRQAKVAP